MTATKLAAHEAQRPQTHFRYAMRVKVANKGTESMITTLIKSAQKLMHELFSLWRGIAKKS